MAYVTPMVGMYIQFLWRQLGQWGRAAVFVLPSLLWAQSPQPSSIIIALEKDADIAVVQQKLSTPLNALQSLQSLKLDGEIFQLNITPEADIIEQLKNTPGIRYAEPNYILSVFDNPPNDPFYAQQWHLPLIGFENIDVFPTVNEGIIIGVIDTGIEKEHPDLQKALWVNPGEDLNGNGAIENFEMNGVDNDNNGYIDDFIGWDFTDAPGLADGGDYLNRDNDPEDDFSRWTRHTRFRHHCRPSQ